MGEALKRLERLLTRWESAEYEHVTIPGETLMTCGDAASAIREAVSVAASRAYAMSHVIAVSSGGAPSIVLPVTKTWQERIARAWASIDGKADVFDRERRVKGLSVHPDTGTYEGYMAEARELMKRSGIMSALEAVAASQEGTSDDR